MDTQKSNQHDMTDAEVLDFIVCMKRKARRSGHVRRVSYTQADREKAVLLYAEIDVRGGSIGDAADVMGMHPTTLAGWLKKATEPESDWNLGSTIGRRINLQALYSSALSGLRGLA